MFLLLPGKGIRHRFSLWLPVSLPALLLCLIVSCTTIDLYEKTVDIPRHEWSSSYQPAFSFTVKDTTALYKVYFIIRHTDQYNFKNIYINLRVKGPGQDSAIVLRRDLLLASNEGWLGEGMDDIYDHRVLIGDPIPLVAGKYDFTVQQIMRQDPLEHVMNAGIRIEKIN